MKLHCTRMAPAVNVILVLKAFKYVPKVQSSMKSIAAQQHQQIHPSNQTWRMLSLLSVQVSLLVLCSDFILWLACGSVRFTSNVWLFLKDKEINWHLL